MDELLPKRIAKMTAEWSIEMRIAARALVLFRTEHPELSNEASQAVGAFLLPLFEMAAIELRDELECIVVTDLAGLTPEAATEWMNNRLDQGCSPLTQRLQELEDEIELKNAIEDEEGSE